MDTNEQTNTETLGTLKKLAHETSLVSLVVT